MAELDLVRVQDRSTFAEYARELAVTVRNNPDDFENIRTSDFLEATASWVEDIDGYSANKSTPLPNVPDWSFIAQLFYAAMIYE